MNPDEFPVVRGIRQIDLGSFRDFAPLITDHHLTNDTFIYRGHADADWKLESRLDRLERQFPTTKNYGPGIPQKFDCPPVKRDEHLEAFKIAARGVRIGPDNLTEREWWALAQHHGLATPLLDWTLSPFVALYFAFEEQLLSRERELYEPQRRAVFCALAHIASKDDRPSGLPVPDVFIPRRAITHRLSSQVGLLMEMPARVDLESNVQARYSGENTDDWESPARPVITKITIPSNDRDLCLLMLERMNINRLTIYGDLDGAARYINGLWELNFNSPLKWLPDVTKATTTS